MAGPEPARRDARPALYALFALPFTILTAAVAAPGGDGARLAPVAAAVAGAFALVTIWAMAGTIRPLVAGFLYALYAAAPVAAWAVVRGAPGWFPLLVGLAVAMALAGFTLLDRCRRAAQPTPGSDMPVFDAAFLVNASAVMHAAFVVALGTAGLLAGLSFRFAFGVGLVTGALTALHLAARRTPECGGRPALLVAVGCASVILCLCVLWGVVRASP
ncbi:MAG: hypothetical protein JXR94_23290 [Candidatus Hydrogenedentes bacterium]|nr:hypothetical protein [Candidatus Hydrogenedentota bacterium]